MKKISTVAYGGLVCLMIVGMSGCRSGKPVETPKHPLEKVHRVMAKTSGYIGEAEKIKLPEDDAAQLSSAKIKLADAENILKAGKYDQAFVLAQNSYQAATRLIKQFYIKEVSKRAETLAGDIQAIAQADDETGLLDFQSRLEKIIGLAARLTQPDYSISPQKVLSDQQQLDIIQKNVADDIRFTLPSDTAFESGRFEVSKKGEAVLKQFVDTRLKATQKNDIQSSPAMMTIKLKVVGYSDLTGFRKYSKTRKMLMKRIEKPDTPSKKKINALLNSKLSELRAQSVADTVQRYIESVFKGVNIRVVQSVVGKGEAPPPGLSAPFPISDPRRRICRIYILVLS